MTYWIVIKGREYYKGRGLFTTNRDLALRFTTLHEAEIAADVIGGRVVQY